VFSFPEIFSIGSIFYLINLGIYRYNFRKKKDIPTFYVRLKLMIIFYK